MKYTRTSLVQQLKEDKALKYLFFWGHTPSRTGEITATCFSQWWDQHPFVSEGNTYRSAEHYMMAGKALLFGDEEKHQEILNCNSPAEAKKLGREVRNFDQEKWVAARCEIVVKGNELKFSQHPELKDYLLGTQSRVIVEASPRDRIWGIGMGRNHEFASFPEKWRGENLLGFCLMEVRDQLKEVS